MSRETLLARSCVCKRAGFCFVCGAWGAGSGHTNTGKFCVYAGRSGSCLHAEMGPTAVNMKLLACKDQEDKATGAAVKRVRTWLRQVSEEGEHG